LLAVVEVLSPQTIFTWKKSLVLDKNKIGSRYWLLKRRVRKKGVWTWKTCL